MEQDRAQGVAAGRAERPLVPTSLRSGNFDVAVEAPGHGMSIRCSTCRRNCLPRCSADSYGIYRGSEAGRAIPEACCTRPTPQTARADARIREAHPRHRGRTSLTVVWWYRHRAVPFLRQGLENRPESPRQSGPLVGPARHSILWNARAPRPYSVIRSILIANPSPLRLAALATDPRFSGGMSVKLLPLPATRGGGRREAWRRGLLREADSADFV